MLEIMFDLTAAQRERVTGAGLDPGRVPLRNMRVGTECGAFWAKCPVIGSCASSETLVLPDGQTVTRLRRRRP